MNVGKTVIPIIYLVVGVVLISIVVSALMVLIYGPVTTERTGVVERPGWNNYRGWWGPYGGGLPGWGGGGHHYPSFPKPPKPLPPPAPPAPPANPPPPPAPPANPPPAPTNP